MKGGGVSAAVRAAVRAAVCAAVSAAVSAAVVEEADSVKFIADPTSAVTTTKLCDGRWQKENKAKGARV